ncbi:hypothetical protein OROMI_002775 [Orobanche minor]
MSSSCHMPLRLSLRPYLCFVSAHFGFTGKGVFSQRSFGVLLRYIFVVVFAQRTFGVLFGYIFVT